MGEMYILGAGLAGCLAGALDRRAQILEAGSEVSCQHKAVLRFRDDKIGEALGIPFRRVTVHKSIFSDGRHHHVANPWHLNDYSRKVAGRIIARSIADLSPVQRFIAPDDLHARLAEMCYERILWNARAASVGKLYMDLEDGTRIDRRGVPVVSTIPLPYLLNAVGESDSELKDHFTFQSIHVQRATVENCDTFQTIYFPDDSTSVYRASLTGNLLTVEAVDSQYKPDLSHVLGAFALRTAEVEWKEQTTQRFGKIKPLPDMLRKRTLLNLTTRYNVYSLGRFACWRNVLLDDVYEDFFRVRSMMALGHYDLIKEITQ